jgi:leucyl-tRNA synthetase
MTGSPYVTLYSIKKGFKTFAAFKNKEEAQKYILKLQDKRDVALENLKNAYENGGDVKKADKEFKNADFILEDGKYLCGAEVEKMSKSKWNVVNPDDIVEKFGADCLRLYEMFLGPLELSKPWNTNGITGVAGFIKKFWRLFTISGNFEVSTEAANKQELKVLHKTIRKVEEDIERFSFNTSVSTFMICVNELSDLKCNKREILEPLTILLSSYAPHIAEEVWSKLGHTESITYARFPLFDEKHLVESSFEYPVSINGKTKFKREYDLGLEGKQIEELIVVDEEMQKYLNGAAPKKIIVVKGKIINVVL